MGPRYTVLAAESDEDQEEELGRQERDDDDFGPGFHPSVGFFTPPQTPSGVEEGDEEEEREADGEEHGEEEDRHNIFDGHTLRRNVSAAEAGLFGGPGWTLSQRCEGCHCRVFGKKRAAVEPYGIWTADGRIRCWGCSWMGDVNADARHVTQMRMNEVKGLMKSC